MKTSLVRMYLHTHVPTSYSRQRYRFSIAIFQLCACILSTLLDLASDYHQHFNYFLPKEVQTKAKVIHLKYSPALSFWHPQWIVAAIEY